MILNTISIKDFSVKAYELWGIQWLLLTAGDFNKGDFNTMTVGWGGFGAMWNMPIALVASRPSRYTTEFMERYQDFTLTAFPNKYHSALSLLGTKSGRDGDKISEAGLTPIASEKITSPGFAEADLIVECKTIYKQDLDPAAFIDPSIEKMYGGYNYHRMYYGEVILVRGTEKYSA